MTGTASPSYGTVDRVYAMTLATTPAADDGPIFMVNLMRYKPIATYGTSLDAQPISGRAADDRYAPIAILQDIGAEVVFVGDVDRQLMGDQPDRPWERIGVVKYPTRRGFIEMQSRQDFQQQHVHKEAGMERTIVMGCSALELSPMVTDPSRLVDWSTVPHPPTPDDGPVVVLHVIRFAEGGREAMLAYQDHAAEVAAPHGARVGAWFRVEGTIVGDGRSWDEVRFNLFPSLAAFMAVATDRARLAAQVQHREPAIADTYAMIVRPMINRLDTAEPQS
jgi:hypothetical protein